MSESTCLLVLIDSSRHRLLLSEAYSGKILKEQRYPPTYIPLGIFRPVAAQHAFLPCRWQQQGKLLHIELPSLTIRELPVTLPPPLQFTLLPNLAAAYLLAQDYTLYRLNLFDYTCCPIGQQTASEAHCSGLCSQDPYIYSCWQHAKADVLLAVTATGEMIQEYVLPGAPTHMQLTENRLYISFTRSTHPEEGVTVLSVHPDTGYLTPLFTVAYNNPALSLYPCYSTLSADKKILYVINEDAASITMIDPLQPVILGAMSTGRSLSTLSLLPDSTLAVATSHMFADLSLLDLTNQRLLSITAFPYELSGNLLVLP